jgi:HAD superfamily hydrolase (TIGR01509 family)
MIELPPDIQGLIFDCDGTLADTTPMHLEAWREALQPLGINCPVDFLDSFRGLPTTDIVKRISIEFGRELDQAALTKSKTEAVQRLLPRTKAIAVVADIARKYRSKLPMSVVSGGTRSNVLTTLAAIGMVDFFQPVITHDDGFPSKPSPIPFLQAAKQMRVDVMHCVVFEDGDLGLVGAELAGMHTIDVRPFTETS